MISMIYYGVMVSISVDNVVRPVLSTQNRLRDSIEDFANLITNSLTSIGNRLRYRKQERP